MKRVFLGGTCNGSEWRSHMEQHLTELGIEFFNPVVEDWDDEAQANEIRERNTCDFCLYVITPKMIGTYSIAEVVDDSNKRPLKTIFVTLRRDDSGRGYISFNDARWKSLGAVRDMIIRNGGTSFTSLEDAARYIDDGIPF